MMIEMSPDGRPTVSRTMTIVTNPACGMPAAPIEAAVAVILRMNRIDSTNSNVVYLYMMILMKPSTVTHLTATIFPNDNEMPRNWAMKMAATASYNAVPSILMVAPTGITNRVTRGSMPIWSKQLIVIGMVAELSIERIQSM